jgi:hypothetical protein
MVHLPRQSPADETENREHEQDGRENGRHAANPTLNPADGRSQHEGKQDSDGNRH